MFGGIVSLWLAIARLRADHWPELEAEIFGTGRIHRAFAAATRHRPEFTRLEWVAAFYPDPDPSPAFVAAVLEELGCALGFAPEEEGLHPRDPLGFWDPEADFADVFFRMERAFDVTLPRSQWAAWDGTFDGLLRWVDDRRTTDAAPPARD